MSHDLDGALRDAMRRHAEAAPSTIDLDAVRGRAREIRRRRTLESLAAGVVAVGLILGLGALVGTLRQDATPPPATTATPDPGALGPLAFTRSKDGSSPLRIVVRAGGVDTEVPNPGLEALRVLGWYGPDHRTLVFSAGLSGQSVLYAATLGEDGRTVGPTERLQVPGVATLGSGIAFPVRGGPIQLWVPLTPSSPNSAASLVTIAPDLAGATTRPMPAGLVPLAITDGHALLREVVGSRVSVAALAGSGAPAPVSTSCSRLAGGWQSLDGSVVALACGDGTVDEVTLIDRSVTRLPAIPDVTSDVGLLNLWWDPSGGLHAATTPTPDYPYGEVHDWDWTGSAWVRAQLQGVLRRVYPVGAPSARLMNETAAPGNLGRWIVESSPEVDLGPSTGSLALAGSAPPSPTATPSSAPPPAALPWIATSPSYTKPGHAGLTDIRVLVDGRTTVVTTAENAIARTIGWYGADHLTLVWEEGNGDPMLEAVTFRADGTLADKPHPLALPGVTPSTRGGGMLFGATVAVPGDGFVTWSEGTGANGSSEYIRVDDALSVVSRTPAGDEAGVLAASRDAFLTQAGNTVKADRIVVHTSTGVTQLTLPKPCDDASEGLFGGPMSNDGSLVPLWCQPIHGVSWSVDLLHVSGLRFTTSLLQGSNIPTFWWDGPTLHASTTDGLHPPVEWGMWQLAGEQWSAAPDGTPVQKVRSGGAVLVKKSDSTWYAEADPEVALDSYDPPAVRPVS